MKRTSREFWDWFYEERWNIPWQNDQRAIWENEQMLKWFDELEVGDHAHVCHYSDISPVTVVARTPKTITVRFDKAERDESWKPEWVAGGFSAICTNIDKQRWNITEDPNGKVEVFRMRKVGWRNRSDEKLYPEWKKYYDYNF